MDILRGGGVPEREQGLAQGRGPPAIRAWLPRHRCVLPCILHSLISSLTVLVGHGTARDDIDILCKHDFSILIIDEVHVAKNPDGKAVAAFNRFPTKLRYGLTGTAMQNNYEELWTILNWARPGEVGDLQQWSVLSRWSVSYRVGADAEQETLRLGTAQAGAEA